MNVLCGTNKPLATEYIEENNVKGGKEKEEDDRVESEISDWS